MFEWDNYSWVSQGLPDGKHGVTGQAKKKKKTKEKKLHLISRMSTDG